MVELSPCEADASGTYSGTAGGDCPVKECKHGARAGRRVLNIRDGQHENIFTAGA
jgi:hypothetical protein